MCPAFSLSPSRLRIAGSSVSDAATDMITTSTVPAAMLRKIVCGTISMPSRAMITVMPLKNTVRLAVAARPADRVELVAARAPRSSRKRDTMNSE